jgi:hypothetical protein
VRGEELVNVVEVQIHWNGIELLWVYLVQEKLPSCKVRAYLVIESGRLQTLLDVKPLIDGSGVFVYRYLGSHLLWISMIYNAVSTRGHNSVALLLKLWILKQLWQSPLIKHSQSSMQDISSVQKIILVVYHHRCDLVTAFEQSFCHLLILHRHLVSVLQKLLSHIRLNPHASSVDYQFVLHFLTPYAQSLFLKQFLARYGPFCLDVIYWRLMQNLSLDNVNLATESFCLNSRFFH